MARLGSACALLGLLLIPFSIGCSSNSDPGTLPFHNKGGAGSVGGNGNSNVGGNDVGFHANTNTSPDLTSGILKGLKLSCGNNKIDDNEQCDDGNKDVGDGCSPTCQLENPNEWDCPKPPNTGACKSLVACGDGKLASSESCDDNNTNDGDGCSADCKKVEDGWTCRMAGKACVPICGDNATTVKEQCDDGNSDNGDGCSSTCQIEPGYGCTPAPSTCTKSECGNGVVEPGESCDAGKNNGLFYGDGKGCSKTCTKEPTCRDSSGKTGPCSHSCGDGNIDPDEKCDDGNQVDGDGCSSSCKSEDGFKCSESKKSDETACPSNPALKCLVLPVTFRDFDGQNVSGGHPDFFYYGAAAKNGRTTGVVKGATATTCVPNSSGTKAPWSSGQKCPNTDQTGPCEGLVASALNGDGKPVYAKGSCPCVFTDWDNTGILGSCPASGTGACTPTTGLTGVNECWVDTSGVHHLRVDTTVDVIQSADSFKQWYTDSDFSTKVLGTLELAATTTGSTTYQFSSAKPGDPAGTAGRTVNDDLHDICLASPHSGTLSTGFFPLETQSHAKVCNIWPYWKSGLDTKCCAGSGCPVISQWDPLAAYDGCPAAGTGGPVPKSDGTGGTVTGVLRNFYMTSEIHYLFHYDGKPGTLKFYGDDDVWVFINGKLVLDLGGSHERLEGTATVGGSDLTAGNTYEIAVFHADTNPRESNYQLTLSGFGTTASVCQPRCGDGVVTGGEECDCSDGSVDVPGQCVGKNDDSKYGGCTTQCKWGPFCGDENVDSPDEECDQGRKNGATYGQGLCTSDCKNAHFCGDKIIDGVQGEECDSGGASDTCDSKCHIIWDGIK